MSASTAASPQALVLWDIDDTLLDTQVTQEAYASAFYELTGQGPQWPVSLRGRTEPEAIAGYLRDHSLDGSLASDFSEELARSWLKLAGDIRIRGRLLSGAHDALVFVAGTPSWRQTIVTGNRKSNAVLKLKLFDIDKFFDLRYGAFGDDGVTRVELLIKAKERAGHQLGTDFSDRNTVAIGDSVRDIKAANSSGVRIIAVATGEDSWDDLRGAGPDYLLPNLEDLPEFSSALTRMIG